MPSSSSQSQDHSWTRSQSPAPSETYPADVPTEGALSPSEGQPDLPLRKQIRAAIDMDGHSGKEKIQSLLRIGIDWLGLEVGALSQIDLAESVQHTVVVAGVHPTLQVGAEANLKETFCGDTVVRDGLLAFGNAEQQGWARGPDRQKHDLSCYLGRKIIVEEELYGTVFFGDREPQSEPLGPNDKAVLELVAHSVEQVLGQRRQQRKPEQARREYESFLEVAPNAAILVDIDTGRIVEANQRAAELTATSREEIVGCNQTVLHPNGDAARYRRLFRECCQSGKGGTIRQFEDGSPIYVQTDSGEEIPVEISAATVESDDQQLAACIFRDITEEKERRRTLESFLQAIEKAADGIAILEDGEYVYVDQTHADLYGFESADTLIGSSWRRLYDAEETARLEEEVFPVLQEEGYWQGPVTGSRPDGTTFPASLSLTMVSRGRLVCTVRDVSEHRRKEQKLRRRSDAMEAATDGMAILSTEGLYQYVNPAHANIYGYDGPETLLGESWTICYGEEEKQRLKHEAMSTLRETGEWRGKARGRRADGSSFPQELTLATIEDGGIICIVRDITARRRAEEELRSTKNFYEQILEKAMKDLTVFSPEGEFEYVNPQSVEDPAMREWLIGRTNEEYCRKRNLDPELGKRRDRAIRTAVQKKEKTKFEEKIKTETGLRHYLRAHSPVTDVEGNVTHVAAFGFDITERKKREQALQERQAKIEALYEATRRVLTAESRGEISDRIHDLLGNVFDYPLRNTGFVDGDTIRPEQTIAEGTRLPSPQSQPREGNSLSAKALQAGDTVLVEDASALDNEVEYGGLHSLAGVPIGEQGVVVVGKMKIESFDPFNLRLIEILSSYAALIIERLEQEETLREAKEEAEEAARLKSAMLANMSHEIRTPLTSIIGFAEALGEEDRQEGASSRFAKLIEKSGRRLLYTLDGVLNLSKLEAGQMALEAQPVDLADQVQDVADELRPRALEKGLSLHLDAAGSVRAWASTGGVQIVVQNLLSNAIKYTEEGEVRVGVWNEEDNAAIAVEDTGVGMDEDRAKHLFEPFRQESEGMSRTYEGTGLGLAVTKKAVDKMDGHIEIESEKGAGSRFVVRLPRPEAGGEAHD